MRDVITNYSDFFFLAGIVVGFGNTPIFNAFGGYLGHPNYF